jgi:hypothetical protein
VMEIEFWPIDRPVPYAKNPRKIPQSAIDKVAASIKEFGWRQSIVVDTDGVIVVGHTRLLAARKLGLLEVPVHVAADLSEAQCRAYRITDNRAGEEARWDDELLKLEISELGALAELTAFDPKELTRLGLGEVATQDAIPAPPASPVARLGQIWQLGKHRLMCGDSTSPECVSRLMGDERAVLFATDPPYAVGYSAGLHPATRANGLRPTAIKTARKSTTKLAKLPSITRTAAAMVGDPSISPFTKSRSNTPSHPTRPSTVGTRRSGKRCSKAFGTKSGPLIISRSFGSRAGRSGLLGL